MVSPVEAAAEAEAEALVTPETAAVELESRRTPVPHATVVPL
jgi:hypothetical protein